MDDIRTSVQSIVTETTPRRPRGAPKGNTNARVHGCRSPRLVEAWRKILKEETDYGRLDREILLVIWQLAIVKSRGATTLVELRLTLRFARLLRTRYGVHADDIEAFENAGRRLAIDLPLTGEVLSKLALAFDPAIDPEKLKAVS